MKMAAVFSQPHIKPVSCCIDYFHASYHEDLSVSLPTVPTQCIMTDEDIALPKCNFMTVTESIELTICMVGIDT